MQDCVPVLRMKPAVLDSTRLDVAWISWSTVLAHLHLRTKKLFVEFCLAHDLHIGDTLFQKPVSKQVTFREAGVLGGPPWSPDRFAHIDFVLVPDRWKNTLVDVSSSPEIFTGSDHFIVCVKCRVRQKQLSSTVVKRVTYSPSTPLENELQPVHFGYNAPGEWCGNENLHWFYSWSSTDKFETNTTGQTSFVYSGTFMGLDLAKTKRTWQWQSRYLTWIH